MMGERVCLGTMTLIIPHTKQINVTCDTAIGVSG